MWWGKNPKKIDNSILKIEFSCIFDWNMFENSIFKIEFSILSGFFPHRNLYRLIFQSFVLREYFYKKRQRVLTLFKSIYLRNRSLSNARWFCGKKCNIGKGNLYLTENWLSRSEMWCASDNHNNMCHIFPRELLDSNFTYAVIYKISIFNKNAPNFTY